MIDLRQGADRNNFSSSPQAYQVSRNSISSRKEFSFTGGRGTRKCETDDDPDSPQIEFQTQTGDYSAYSPPFWASTKETSSKLLQHNHHYSSPSRASRLQVIQDGRRELMKMVKGLPESSYELSLKDIVNDEIMMPEVQEDMEKKVEQKNVKKTVKRKISRSQSMNTDVFLLKMFIPSCLSCKKKSTFGDRSKVSQMSSFDGYEKPVDKEWWSVRYLIPRKNRSNSSGSSSSRSSSGSTSRLVGLAICQAGISKEASHQVAGHLITYANQKDTKDVYSDYKL